MNDHSRYSKQVEDSMRESTFDNSDTEDLTISESDLSISLKSCERILEITSEKRTSVLTESVAKAKAIALICYGET